MNEKKNILVAVSGGIAVYKVCDLVSKLSRENVEIRVLMTENAKEFVSPITFEALSHNPVSSSMFHDELRDPIPHITLAKWADVIIVAPATANIIAKMTAGIADDLFTSTMLAATCPIILCPAMNTNMLENPVTQRNLKTAAELGWHIVDPDYGHLACIDQGKGRLPETKDLIGAIFAVLAGQNPAPNNQMPAEAKPEESDRAKAPNSERKEHFHRDEALEKETGPESSREEIENEQKLVDDEAALIQPLRGIKVVVSAGPTEEDIDPVRFVTNHSSGKQGYAIAKDAVRWGADVVLISGPVELPPVEGAHMVKVRSAVQMQEAVEKAAADADFVIMAAAVADYRPSSVADQKIKKNDETMTVEFVKNPDILKGLGASKPPHQVLCGFAMETQNLDQNAREKLESKNCDLLIANNLKTEGAGFHTDTNVVSLLKPDSIEHLPVMSKKELGYRILADMLEIWKGRNL